MTIKLEDADNSEMRLQNTISSLTETLEGLNGQAEQIRSLSEKLDEAEQMVFRQVVLIDTVSETVQQDEAREMDLGRNITMQQAEIDKLEDKCAHLDVKNKDLENQFENTEKDLTESRNQNTLLQNEIDRLESDVKAEKDKYIQLTDELITTNDEMGYY